MSQIKYSKDEITEILVTDGTGSHSIEINQSLSYLNNNSKVKIIEAIYPHPETDYLVELENGLVFKFNGRYVMCVAYKGKE